MLPYLKAWMVKDEGRQILNKSKEHQSKSITFMDAMECLSFQIWKCAIFAESPLRQGTSTPLAERTCAFWVCIDDNYADIKITMFSFTFL